ncbi:MAG: serine protease [Candidatus Kerfeldbacteria bacterium]|nr:serine protease [Candidatus Kerfeldbacteria bacterium]
MKPRTSPTSPKVIAEEGSDIEKLYGTQLKSFDRPRVAPRPSMVWLMMILIIGFAAGIVGQLSLIWFSNELPFLEQLGFSSSDSPSVVLTSRNKDRVLTAEQVETIAQDLDHTLVTIYPAHTSSAGLENQYVSSEKVGEGFVITEDGYVIIDATTVVDDQSYVAIGYDGSVYAVSSVMRDSATPYAILKLDANKLSTVAFSDIDSIRNSEEVVALARDTGSRGPRILKTSIQQTRYYPVSTGADLYFSTDRYQARVLLGSALDSDFLHAVVFTLDKKALGILVREHDTYVVVPFSYVSNILESSFVSGRIIRPSFGVHYVTLDMLADGSRIADGASQGAYITSFGSESGVVSGSLAEKAGIQIGDIITEINSTPLTESETLSELILNHEAGDTLAVTLIRDGTSQKINLTIE